MTYQWHFLCQFIFLLIPPLILALRAPQIDRNLTTDSSGHQRHIRVLFYHNPPDAISECRKFPYLKRTSMQCRFPGHCIEILTLITDYLHLKIDPIVYHTNQLGRYDNNGTAFGLLALLANGTVDTICKRFARNARNRQIFDFSRTLHAVNFYFFLILNFLSVSQIAVRRLAGQNREGMWNLFYPFTASTWMAISSMLLAQLLVFAVITNAESRIIRRPTFDEFQILWRMFRVQLQQPDGVKFYSMSGRFSAFVFGFLQCMLILSLYQSYIVTSLVSKKSELPFQTLDELIPMVEKGRYKFAAPPTNHWFYDMVEQHSDPRYRRLKKALQKYPVELYENDTRIMQLVESGTHVAVVQDDSPLKWEGLAFCDVVFVSGGMPEKAVHFMFTKGSDFVRLFNEGIGHEAVFMHRKHWKYSYLAEQRRNRLCADHEAEVKRFKPLGVVPFFGLSIVLLVGFVLSSLTFLAELAIFYFKRGKRAGDKVFSAKSECSGGNVGKGPSLAMEMMANALRADALRTDDAKMMGMERGNGNERVKTE